MPATAFFAIPYPSSGDPVANGAADMQAIAEKVETLLRNPGAFAAYGSPQISGSASGQVPSNAGASTVMRYTSTTTADASNTITNPNTAVGGDGKISLTKAGRYRIRVRHHFGTNATGTRMLDLFIGATNVAKDSRTAPGTAGTGAAVAVEWEGVVAAGTTAQVQLRQDSGAALDVLGGGLSWIQVTYVGAS